MPQGLSDCELQCQDVGTALEDGLLMFREHGVNVAGHVDSFRSCLSSAFFIQEKQSTSNTSDQEAQASSLAWQATNLRR